VPRSVGEMPVLTRVEFDRRRAALKLVVAMGGSLFLAYIVGVGALLWRMQRRVRAARPVCPHCRAALNDMSERVASATGRCDMCGGQILES